MRRVKSRKVLCPFCSKSFTRTEHLQRHLGSHGVGKAIPCPRCGKDFMRKDVMKRHLDKCQLKPRPETNGDIIGNTADSSVGTQGHQAMSDAGEIDAHQQSRVREDVQTDHGSQPQLTEYLQNHIVRTDSHVVEPGGPCLLPETPSSEARWNDMGFDDIRFLLDPTFLDRDNNGPAHQMPPAAVGVPCIDIDPADTFNFLARIANKETASLEARYDCGSFYERQWAGCEIMDDNGGGQQASPQTATMSPSTGGQGVDPGSDRWHPPSTSVQINLPSSQKLTSLARPAYEIVQQIKVLSSRSTIMHTWSRQLERDCARFFSPKNLEKFIRIYWASWYPHYPVIHKPTFSIPNAPAHLTAAMAIIGACFSPNSNDRHSAKLWLNSVEEMVFSNRYFGDIILHDPATVNMRDIVQLLQAAHCVCTFQISEGSQVSRRRIRRQRFNLLVSLARDLNLFNVVHSHLDSLQESEFCWDSFVATEECIRTMLFVYTHDTGFAIFSNYPPRTRIQEMSLGMACPEACFQAQSAVECFMAIKTWTSHPLRKCQMRLRDIVQTMLCPDVSLDVQAYFSHLGILNLWILQPMRRAVRNWKLAWNQRYVLQDNFGLPKEEDRVLVRPEDSWRRLGFFQNASEYWLLLNILVRRIGEQQKDQSVSPGSHVPGSVNTRPYTPSRCDSPTMADLKHLISEHHRRFTSYA
ncbi:hypothetical protein BDV59DRAFT_209967 [Aspergillus ambiguus]|uniref:uncharacterized protein n=1 Tax=Aspergillus ambiguus TaxID=176160 RepID=UPI003CCE1F54